jgi:hypothetical protein
MLNIYDVRTIESAYNFLKDITGFSKQEIKDSYYDIAHEDFNIFYDEISNAIVEEDLNDIKIVCFHILGSLDDCAEIRRIGLRNLQYVLSEKTILRGLLEKEGIIFDIENHQLWYKNQKINLFRNNDISQTQNEVARRIYKDYCVNVFLANDVPQYYGDDVYKRPEFLKTLSDFLPAAKSINDYWKNHSKSYKLTMMLNPNQISNITFDLDYTEEMHSNDFYKWLIKNAIRRISTQTVKDDMILYIKNNSVIKPSQIIDYTEL